MHFTTSRGCDGLTEVTCLRIIPCDLQIFYLSEYFFGDDMGWAKLWNKGCHVLDGTLVCHCDHLTHFGLLLNPALDEMRSQPLRSILWPFLGGLLGGCCCCLPFMFWKLSRAKLIFAPFLTRFLFPGKELFKALNISSSLRTLCTALLAKFSRQKFVLGDLYKKG